MFGMFTKNSSVKEVLVISLTNLGDVILTTPILDVLLEDFPQARLTVVIGPKAASLFAGQSRIQTVIFEKQKPVGYYWRWYQALWVKKFDVIIDLRQTFLALFLYSRWKTPVWATQWPGHMIQKHMRRFKMIYRQARFIEHKHAIKPKALPLPFEKFIVIAPGAADSAKRWPMESFKDLILTLVAKDQKIVLVGDENDSRLIERHVDPRLPNVVSLAGKTDLRELCYVLSKGTLLIGNDSGIMHLANYVALSQVVLWGPTDLTRYGPWNSKHVVIHKGPDMSKITTKDVLDAIEQVC